MISVGRVLDSNNSGKFEIIEIVDSGKIKIKFLGTGFERFAQKCHILTGSVRDYSRKSYLGVGVADKGADVKSNVFVAWTSMLSRCYSDRSLKANPSYEGCTVSDYFKKFENFKEWYETQTSLFGCGALDKDLLIKGNKIYAEDTCVVIPMEINNLILNSKSTRGYFPVGVHYSERLGKFKASVRKHGKTQHLGYFKTSEEAFYVYKQEKETYIKDIAEKWKERIDPRVYEALLNYKVEITD